ncbi:hypothetical protein LINPERHAP2_LOCUS10876 [Linum perenne]
MAPNNKFILNVVTTVTSTLPNGDLWSDMVNRMYKVNLASMLNVHTAIPLVQTISTRMGSMSIFPMHHSIVEKMVISAHHIVAANGYRFPMLNALPFVTVCISVDHGVVSASGVYDAEKDDDEDEDDY